MHRRAPRHVIWPARLLWLPLVSSGLPLMMHVHVDVDKVQEGSWRVLVSLPPPVDWVGHPGTFWPGLLLLLGGWAAFALQAAGTARLRAAAYGRLAAAAWVFLAISVLATWRFEGFVAEVQRGFDWRFLAHLRTTGLDRALLAFSLAAGVACWVLSWGRSPVEGRRRQPRGQDQQEPPGPAA